MERSKTQTVNELFGNLLEQEPDLHEGLLEQKALLFFKEQLGDYLRDIVNIHITNGTIYIRTYSNALRQTIELSRTDFIKEINEHIGAQLIEHIKVSLY